MTLRDLVLVLLRRWWLVAIVPAIVLPLLIVRARTQPYQTKFNAVVLIPGDTEIPGNSERPELMVLDDLPTLVSSRVFADAVAADLQGRGSTLTDGDVEGAISGSRYSRVLTISVTRDDAAQAKGIAESAAEVLPAQVNQYLVADQSKPATVQIIDPPGDPVRSRPNQSLVFVAMTLLAVAVGAGLALLAHAWSSDARLIETSKDRVDGRA
jgi:capsular polysaccharide biosynthesis protein